MMTTDGSPDGKTSEHQLQRAHQNEYVHRKSQNLSLYEEWYQQKDAKHLLLRRTPRDMYHRFSHQHIIHQTCTVIKIESSTRDADAMDQEANGSRYRGSVS